MKMKSYKKALVLLSMVAASPAFAKTCPVNPSVQPIVKPFFASVTATHVGGMRAMETTVTTAIKQQADILTSSLKTLSSQKALAATQINHAIQKNTEIEASAKSQAELAEKQFETMRDLTRDGIGHEPCAVLRKRSEIVSTDKQVNANARRKAQTEITARAGAYSSRKDALATRLALHEKLYCTESQAESGMCSSVGSRAGNNLKAETLFRPATEGSDEDLDKNAFINNIMGLPNDVLTAEQASSSIGILYADNSRRLDAIKSTAAVSLKNIQAMWTKPEGDHDHDSSKDGKKATTEKEHLKESEKGNIKADKKEDSKKSNEKTEKDKKDEETLSLMEQLERDVGRYFGGEEYAAWSKTLVGANEKGVLRENLQVKALRLYMQAKKYEQLQRMEAMLAATLSAELATNGMETEILKKRYALRNNDTSIKVVGE